MMVVRVMTSINPHYVKHVPQRTCLACRQVKAKQELVRLVCISNGRVEVDFSGKKAGRGAYLCPVQECWETGLKGNRLEHSFNIVLTQDNREQLTRIKQDFLKEQVSG